MSFGRRQPVPAIDHGSDSRFVVKRARYSGRPQSIIGHELGEDLRNDGTGNPKG